MIRAIVVGLLVGLLFYGGYAYQVSATEKHAEQEETTVVAGERTYVEVEDPKPAWERQGMTEAEYEAWAAEVRKAREGEQEIREIQSKMEQDMQPGGKLDKAKQRKEAFDAKYGG